MTYLLDTNACIRYLNDRNSPVAQRLAMERPQDVVLCSVVQGELCYGAHRSQRKASNLALLAVFFGQFASLPFDDPAAEVSGRLRAELEAAGTPIGPHDLQIAAIALVNNLTLVTHNTREFGRVPGLLLEDWESPIPETGRNWALGKVKTEKPSGR